MQKLAALPFADRVAETREASPDDTSSLGRALEGAAAVINCAGPFLDTADFVASTAVEKGIHYLDVTAEQCRQAADSLAGAIAGS